MRKKLSKEEKEKRQKDFITLYCNAFDIPQDVTEVLLILVTQDKWINKKEETIRWNISRLSNFDRRFQLELANAAVGGEYQGIVFPNSKAQEQRFLKQYGTTKNERLERVLNHCFNR